MKLKIKPNADNNCLELTMYDKRSESNISLTLFQISELFDYLKQERIKNIIVLSDYGEEETIYGLGIDQITKQYIRGNKS